MRLVITGASRGLGKVCVDHFSKTHEVLRMSQSETEHVISLSYPYWSEVDAVIHTAGGGMGLRHPILQAGELYKLFRLNIGSAVEVNRMVLPHMKEKRRGNVVHVCSIASGEAIGSVGYNTVKTALSGYVRSLGREMAPFGVVVSGIAPGAFTAPQGAMERLREANPASYQEFVKDRLPRGFMGKAEELLPLLEFLVSEQASMMGGCIVPIDAGEGHYYS